MQKYLKLTKHLIQEFEGVELEQVPRSQNTAADEILKLASSENGRMDENLAMEIHKHPCIEEVPTFIIQSGSSWMTLIVSFLHDGHLPQDPDEARKIKKGQPDSLSLMTSYTKEVSPCHT